MDAAQPPFGSGYALMLQEMGDALDVGVVAVDRELRVTHWNRWLEVASGLPAHCVIGRPASEVVPGLNARGAAALERSVQGATAVLSQSLHGRFIDLPAPRGFAEE